MRLLSRNDLIQKVASTFYSEKILNNSHRGDLVEMLVLNSLEPEWKFVGLRWHPWDLERVIGKNRIRIQVKQVAAIQLWGDTIKPTLVFGWKKNPPSYFERDNPGVHIEKEGWFCEIFIFGLHLEKNSCEADQVDPNQWKFLVIPTTELENKQGSMVLSKALKRWSTISWCELRKKVNDLADQLCN